MAIRIRRVLAGFALLVSATGVLVTLGADPADAGPKPVILGYVPLPADDFQRGLETINAAADTTLDYTVGITNAGNGSVVVYDHWEDGFEADLANPAQTTTEVWGDGSPANGDAATYCTSCPGDLLTPGDVFVLRNNITTPRNPAEIRFDGGDKVAATRGFAITVGGWSTPLGSVFADAVAAYDITKFGTSFVVPIGPDTPYPVGSTPAFEYTGATVMAAVDGTVVEVDREGDGTVDVTDTIDEGDSLYVDGGLLEGALITSSDPVQVHLITGDVGATYEARFIEVFPVELASDDYVNPVGSATANQQTVTYLYNPNDDAITVTPTCTGCTTPIVMPGHSGAQLASPLGQAVRFTSGGQPFIAVGAMGTHSGAGGQTDSTSVFDWGFSLVPAGLLTTQAVLGWAPGNSAVPPSDDDDGPVWVTTTAPTMIRVDYDGDPTTGVLGADCFGQHDVELSVAALVSTRLTDVADNDMTGARVYTCDGTSVIGAWGEDPGSAPTGNPGLDAGYTLLPSTVMVVDKNDGLHLDANNDGRYGPGDTIEYSVSIGNAGNLTFTNLSIDDTLPAGLAYGPGAP